MRAILFVDDHEVLARLSCEILEMQGYRAVSAYNGEERCASSMKMTSIFWSPISAWTA